MEAKGKKLYGRMAELVEEYNAPCTVNTIGSLGCVFFTAESVNNYDEAKQADTAEFSRYFKYMLEHHIHLAPSQFEAMFLSEAHTDENIEETLEAFEGYLKTRK